MVVESDNWISFVSIGISLTALAMSAVTFWLTSVHRGTVKLTRPSVIFFGPDGGAPFSPKVYFRAMMFSTSRKGRIVEHMFVRLQRGDTSQDFSVWTHGERSDLVRGSGAYIGPEGFERNFHFLTTEKNYEFLTGSYTAEVYISLFGEQGLKLISTTRLDITPAEAEKLKNGERGLYFDWSPQAQRYLSHVQEKPSSANPIAGIGATLDRMSQEEQRSKNEIHP